MPQNLNKESKDDYDSTLKKVWISTTALTDIENLNYHDKLAARLKKGMQLLLVVLKS